MLRARIKELEQRLYGRKSEQRAGSEKSSSGSGEHRKRGQQPGAPGHGRVRAGHLPVREEDVDLSEAAKRCPSCRLALAPFPGTEDCDVLEVEVQAYVRRYRRRRYRPLCDCGVLPGIVTAPAPNRLIPRGKHGISVWVTVLLDKFLYLRPTRRLLQDLEGHGLRLSQGSVTGGLRALAPLFEPLVAALRDRQLSERLYHADETRWPVFVVLEGKAGHRWQLWVFRSRSAVVYRLDPTRAARVPEAHFAGVTGGILVCDRYSAYKKMAKTIPLLLAFCWAHVRRDFLAVAHGGPDDAAWTDRWIAAIAKLYKLNDKRLDVREQPAPFAKADGALRTALTRMAERRDAELRDRAIPVARRKVLESLCRHWHGLTLFADHPEVPMDNNLGEQVMRGPAVARKNFYGSGSRWSGELAASLFSIFETLKLWNINPRRWLSAYLEACAEAGNRPPAELGRFLPWAMAPAQLQAFIKPP